MRVPFHCWFLRLTALLILPCFFHAARAQFPKRPPEPPPQLLHVRLDGPPGMQVTLYQGTPRGRGYPAPVNVALRPGYLYRLKLSSIPGHAGLDLYPSLEVRGTLHLPPNLRAAEYPAPVVFSQEEIDGLLSGSLLTKAVYLEDPSRAWPIATKADQPLEITVRPGDDPLEEARLRGRPMVIVRLGGRALMPEDLARASIPGTILFPGGKVLHTPRVPPWIPWTPVAFYDPRLGPKPPTEECLSDGGDAGPRAGIGPDGQLLGLDPTDTVAEYSDSRQRRQVAVSNRICICAPRFAVVRSDTNLVGYETVLGPGSAQTLQEHGRLQARTPSLQTRQAEQLVALGGRLRPTETGVKVGLDSLVRVQVLDGYDVDMGSGTVLGTAAANDLTQDQRTRLVRQMELARQLSHPFATVTLDREPEGPAVVGRIEGTDAIATIQASRDVNTDCKDELKLPDKPLVLYKWADRGAAQVGDVVTFFLKYKNVGGQPITNIAVADSLTPRLEYLAGSARSDRDAVLTLQANQSGSVVLRWEVGGRLLPGESGVVTFQARVR